MIHLVILRVMGWLSWDSHIHWYLGEDGKYGWKFGSQRDQQKAWDSMNFYTTTWTEFEPRDWVNGEHQMLVKISLKEILGDTEHRAALGPTWQSVAQIRERVHSNPPSAQNSRLWHPQDSSNFWKHWNSSFLVLTEGTVHRSGAGAPSGALWAAWGHRDSQAKEGHVGCMGLLLKAH